MGWADKAHKKHKIDKMIEQAMNSPEYKEAQKKDRQQSTLEALCLFCFLMCEFLETKYRYKFNGLMNFLMFAKGKMKEVGENENYFLEKEKYFKEKYNLDVLSVFDLHLGEDDDNEKH